MLSLAFQKAPCGRQYRAPRVTQGRAAGVVWLRGDWAAGERASVTPKAGTEAWVGPCTRFLYPELQATGRVACLLSPVHTSQSLQQQSRGDCGSDTVME